MKVAEKGNSPPTWYPEWAWQLAGYAMAVADEQFRLEKIDAASMIPLPTSFWSVVINTNPEHPKWRSEDEPGYWTKKWNPKLVEHGAKVMISIANLFYTVHDKPNAPLPWPGTPERRAMQEALEAPGTPEHGKMLVALDKLKAKEAA